MPFMFAVHTGSCSIEDIQSNKNSLLKTNDK